jgi:hypothetical protein
MSLIRCLSTTLDLAHNPLPRESGIQSSPRRFKPWHYHCLRTAIPAASSFYSTTVTLSMAETSSALVSRMLKSTVYIKSYKGLTCDAEMPFMPTLQEQYHCPHFRILVIGRANAGKTTILEKVCGVAKGTSPIIYNKSGDKLEEGKLDLFHMSSTSHIENQPLVQHICYQQLRLVNHGTKHIHITEK